MTDIERSESEEISLSESKAVFPVSREELYKQVWSQPMTELAKYYDVSSSYLARVCSRLNVPRPERGYWAKLAVGKEVTKPSLPEPEPGSELEWAKDGVPAVSKSPLPQPPRKPRRRVKANKSRTQVHRLIRGARELFLVGRETDHSYLKPNKKLLVDMIVSKKALDNALEATNQLFLAFEDFDYRVQLAPKGVYFNRPDVDEREKADDGYRMFNHWSPYRSTVVYVGTVAIGLTLYELSEQIEMRYLKGKYVPVSEIKPKAISFDNYSWTTIKDHASGKFRLRAYSPYGGTSWQHEWKIDCSKDLNRLGHKIAKELALHAETISALVEEAERKAEIERQRWEEERERWRREEEERRKAKAIKDSREELFKVIERWAEVKGINDFFQEVESLSQNLEPEQKTEINERLEKARELIGELDAIESLTSWRAPDER